MSLYFLKRSILYLSSETASVLPWWPSTKKGIPLAQNDYLKITTHSWWGWDSSMQWPALPMLHLFWFIWAQCTIPLVWRTFVCRLDAPTQTFLLSHLIMIAIQVHKCHQLPYFRPDWLKGGGIKKSAIALLGVAKRSIFVIMLSKQHVTWMS